MKFTPKFLIQAALLASIYAALTVVLGSFGYGPVQFRVSEALTVLPAVMPAAIPGLFIGCILANWLGGFGMIDIVFGSLATLLAALSTYFLRKHRFLLPLPPVLFNAVIVGTYVYLLYDNSYSIVLTMLFIGVSELIICYGLGLPLLSFIKENRVLNKILETD
ncbi:MAG: QueT transporter family protein [Clostridiaceae bacterium]|nr:QueT transporter family protein [Clostridiaceae bacterium]